METIVLRTFDTTFSASILLTRLQAEGIQGYLRDDYNIGINPLLSNAMGGVKLEVDVRDAERAVVLMEEFEEEYMRLAICPVCHHTEFKRLTNLLEPNLMVKLLSRLFGKKAPLNVRTTYKCGHCNYESENLPSNFVGQNEAAATENPGGF